MLEVIWFRYQHQDRTPNWRPMIAIAKASGAMLAIVRHFEELDAKGDGYPEQVAAVDINELSALGGRYLEETRSIRTGRPRFVDKMPNNFSHVGLIHTILPKASINLEPLRIRLGDSLARFAAVK